MNLFGGMKKDKPEKNKKYDRVHSELESTKVRKETAVSVYEKEIAEIENQKNSIISQIGKLAYSKYLDHEEINLALFNESWTELDKLTEDLEIKKSKQGAIIARYDEELEMLEKELNYLEHTEASSETDRFCSQCGAKIIVGSCFCEQCGVKLD